MAGVFNASKNAAARALAIRIYPAPRDLRESREILQHLKQYGEIATYKNLKASCNIPNCLSIARLWTPVYALQLPLTDIALHTVCGRRLRKSPQCGSCHLPDRRVGHEASEQQPDRDQPRAPRAAMAACTGGAHADERHV
jgi:hypothetical protein